MTPTASLDFSHVEEALKDFQRLTVDHVTERLYGDDPTSRFLVADEVGLGKTLVATGVIARAIQHHGRNGKERVDVIYICSNGDIARQNTARIVSRLGIPGLERVQPIERVTLLPRAAHRLNPHGVNIVALTPGTSFNLRSSEGRAEERALLYALLREAWGVQTLRGNPALRVFAGWSDEARFKRHVDRYQHDGQYDADLAEDFVATVADRDRRRPTLRDEFEELRQLFSRPRRQRPDEHLRLRREFIGELRDLLARTCIRALQPELVVLDEFQRFKGLLDGTDPASELGRVLFDYEDVRLLLLSATPYKMYTLDDEADDDHYRDLVRTFAFLAGEDAADGFADDLRAFRRALLTADVAGRGPARDAKTRTEAALRRVMVRTERLAASETRHGMLAEPPAAGVRLAAADLHGYVGLVRVSELVDGGPVLDFWKDSAYPLNFMEDYKLSRELAGAFDNRRLSRELSKVLVDQKLLPWEDVEAYRQVDPANARLRGLVADVIDTGAWQLAWLPPALPYYQLEPPWADPRIERFTKRLVFSAWKVVPKVIAALLSYETERLLATAGGPAENTPAARRRFAPLLQFTRSDGRLTGMPAFALLYPSPQLALLGDPRAVAAELGGASGAVSKEAVLGVVRDRVAAALARRLAGAPDTGAVDEAWYWAAPVLLDADADRGWNADWWAADDLASQWPWHEEEDETAERSTAGWADHVEQARTMIDGRATALGRPPDDLVEVVAELAVAAPGVAALRALGRLVDLPDALLDGDLRDWAAYVAWGFRSLFNQPEITALLRGRAPERRRRDDAYWRLVLRYCLSGGLQAVLDEYAHVLPEALGVREAPADQRVEAVAETMRTSLSIRTANYGVDELAVHGEEVDVRRHQMRGRFALRFGDERSAEERTAQRQSDIRVAFNSPFWPFVLATTSVGQEGLDFHQYCHAVVHWNLPANPVDLEQREGRVHRYKGHAVRKNVAAAHRAVAFGTESDPWEALFGAAAAERAAHLSELVPYWVYTLPEGAQIERHVPALPLSRDAARLEALRRSLAAYRLVFGQPRQEDLMAYLRSRFSPEDIRELLDELCIDLSPRPVRDGETG